MNSKFKSRLVNELLTLSFRHLPYEVKKCIARVYITKSSEIGFVCYDALFRPEDIARIRKDIVDSMEATLDAVVMDEASLDRFLRTTYSLTGSPVGTMTLGTNISIWYSNLDEKACVELWEEVIGVECMELVETHDEAL